MRTTTAPAQVSSDPLAPIRGSIHRGLYTGLWYLLLARHLSHSWLEADVDGRWRRVDAYINGDAFCQAAARELERHGWPEGCSLAGTYCGGEAIDLDAGQFIQMEAVEGDDGVWTEPADYCQGTHYRNRAGPIRAMLYRHVISSVNRRIESLREAALANGSPGVEHKTRVIQLRLRCDVRSTQNPICEPPPLPRLDRQLPSQAGGYLKPLHGCCA